ncbi:unnamed protein product, partial [Ixodes hexagonus]
PRGTEERSFPNGLEVGQASPAQVDTTPVRGDKLQSQRKGNDDHRRKIPRERKKYYGKSTPTRMKRRRSAHLETNSNGEVSAESGEGSHGRSKTRNSSCTYV